MRREEKLRETVDQMNEEQRNTLKKVNLVWNKHGNLKVNVLADILRFVLYCENHKKMQRL